jgi:hypothetical protein
MLRGWLIVWRGPAAAARDGVLAARHAAKPDGRAWLALRLGGLAMSLLDHLVSCCRHQLPFPNRALETKS